MSTEQAIQILVAAGAVFSLPVQRHLTTAQAAALLGTSVWYVRNHISEFPNAWRMPGGDIRIPTRDVEALANRNRINR